MRTLRSLAPWLPWIAYLIIAAFQREIALVAGLVLVVALALLKLYRGILMWVTLGFFAAATIAVIGLHNAWTAHNLGFLANGALASAAWCGLLVGKPFTMDAARETTDPVHWDHPVFIRINVVISAVWALAFTVNAAAALALTAGKLHGWAGIAIPVGSLAGAIVFTARYPKRAVRAAQTGDA